MSNKNNKFKEPRIMTISDYVQDMTNMFEKYKKLYNSDILNKLLNGEKLEEMELYFIAMQLDLVEDLKK